MGAVATRYNGGPFPSCARSPPGRASTVMRMAGSGDEYSPAKRASAAESSARGLSPSSTHGGRRTRDRQVVSTARGSARRMKAMTAESTQAAPGIPAYMCAACGTTRCTELGMCAAIAQPHRGPVAGSRSPEMMSTGASERTGSR